MLSEQTHANDPGAKDDDDEISSFWVDGGCFCLLCLCCTYCGREELSCLVVSDRKSVGMYNIEKHSILEGCA